MNEEDFIRVSKIPCPHSDPGYGLWCDNGTAKGYDGYQTKCDECQGNGVIYVISKDDLRKFLREEATNDNL
jgi:hypothetical protein